jgi:antitoxin VapB
MEDGGMPLNIKDSETHELARELAKRTGESLTFAVKRSIEERLLRVRSGGNDIKLADQLDRIALDCASLPVLDARSADEILGYDDAGLPA